MAAVDDGGVVYARTEEEMAAFGENVARVVNGGGEVAKVVCCVKDEMGIYTSNESVDDAFVGRVAEAVGSTLRKIDLLGCKNITDAGLGALAGGCGGLRRIILWGNNITDAGEQLIKAHIQSVLARFPDPPP